MAEIVLYCNKCRQEHPILRAAGRQCHEIVAICEVCGESGLCSGVHSHETQLSKLIWVGPGRTDWTIGRSGWVGK